MEDIMSDTTTAKTKSLGMIDAAKARKISGFEAYTKSVAALMDARKQTTAAKDKVKAAIKKQLGHEGDDLDFAVESNGTVRVFQNLVQKEPRATSRMADLSDKF
jgi:hypothetical protein